MRSTLTLISLGLILAACEPADEVTALDPSATAPPIAAEVATSAAIGAWGIDLEARDRSSAPGDDFDRYANGSWLDSFAIPPDLSRYGTFVQLSLDAEADVRDIVEELAAGAPAPGSLEQKVGDFYASWMDVGRLDGLGGAALAPRLQAIAVIEDHSGLMQMFSSLHMAAPFELGIIPDPADTTRYIAIMEQGGLGLPDRDYYLESDERFVEYRQGYRNYIQTMLGLAGFDDVTARAQAIIPFETALAEVQWTQQDSRDIQKIYNPMSPAEVTELAPEFDWSLIFDARGLGEIGTFVVAETTAIDASAEIVAATPLAVLKDYLALHFIRAHARYLSSDFDTTHFEFYSRMLQGTEEQRERWKRGVQEVNAGLGEAVGQIYVERHFPTQTKTAVDALVANLVAAMQERLRDNKWMDDATRERALVKLGTFEPRIGYPNKWTDYGALEIRPGALLENALALREFQWQQEVERLGGPVDREIWNIPPQTVNAFYNPLLNQITFPAAILQPPFFDPHADAAVNYGAIGAVIGHEIGHGFDDQGRRFDELGRIRDWWTEIADERFSERAARLGAQYETYEPLPGMSINGQLTMGENIGDLGGVQMAYAAYHHYLDAASNGQAPVLDGLTGEQRFFLSWAQVWRALTREDETRRRLVTDSHSPPSYRINGVVRNVDAWYEAFGVSEQHALYLPPADRVRIW